MFYQIYAITGSSASAVLYAQTPPSLGMAVVAGLNIEAMKPSGEKVPIYMRFKLAGPGIFESGVPLGAQPIMNGMTVLEIRPLSVSHAIGDDLGDYFECYEQQNYQTHPVKVQKDTALALLHRLFETVLGMPVEEILLFTLYKSCFLELLPFKKILFMPLGDERGFLSQNLIRRCRLYRIAPHRLVHVQAFSPTKLKAQFFEVIPSACQYPSAYQAPIYLKDAYITQQEVYKLADSCDFIFVSDLAPQMLPYINFGFANCVIVNEALDLQSKYYSINEYAYTYLQYQDNCVKAEILLSLGYQQLVLNSKDVSSVFEVFIKGYAYNQALEAVGLQIKNTEEERLARLQGKNDKQQARTTSTSIALRNKQKEPEEESYAAEDEDGDGDDESSDAPRRGRRAHLDGGLGQLNGGLGYVSQYTIFGARGSCFTTNTGGGTCTTFGYPLGLQAPGLAKFWGGK